MSDGTFVLEVTNDGVRYGDEPAGMGLRLAGFEALQPAACSSSAPATRALAGFAGRPLRGLMTLSSEQLDALGEQSKLRVLIVDDHDVVHWGFRLDAQQRAMGRTEPQRALGRGGLRARRALQPDVALVDLFIGEESGPEISQQLRERSPQTKVLLISGAGRISPGAAKAAGASGFIPKDWGAADNLARLRMVGLGMTVFQPQNDDAATALSPREREVLDLIAGGSTNREIAAALHLSPHTIHEHTSSLYRKLGARNRARRGPAGPSRRPDRVNAARRCSSSRSAAPVAIRPLQAARGAVGLAAHASFMEALVDAGFVILGGPARRRGPCRARRRS